MRTLCLLLLASNEPATPARALQAGDVMGQDLLYQSATPWLPTPSSHAMMVTPLERRKIPTHTAECDKRDVAICEGIVACQFHLLKLPSPK